MALKINLSSVKIPEGAYVKSAYLSLYRLGTMVEGSDKNFIEKYSVEEKYGQDSEMELCLLTNYFDTSLAYWGDDHQAKLANYRTFNSITGDAFYTHYYKLSSAVKNWIEFDVTKQVDDYLSRPDQFYGLCIRNWWKFTGQGGSRNWSGSLSEFVSSDNVDNIDERPKLTIVYDYDSFVRLVNFSNEPVAYQRYEYPIKWVSNINSSFNIDLIKDGAVVYNIAQNVSGESYTWLVSPDSPVGDGFYIKISNSSSSHVSEKTLKIRANPAVKDLPYEMDFEKFEYNTDFFNCNWFQKTGRKFEWSVGDGSTPSRKLADKNKTWVRIGPKNGVNGGKYLYTEGKYHNNLTSELWTPFFDLTSVNDAKLKFWYYLNVVNGASQVGDLYVDILIDGTWTKGIFHEGGKNYGDSWKQAVIDLTPYKGKVVQFAFRSKHKDADCDIGIDDFSVEGNVQVANVSLKNSEKNGLNFSVIHNALFFNNVLDISILKIFSPSGRLIFQKKIKSGESGQLNLSQLNIPQGFYLISLESKNQHITKRFLNMRQ